MFLLPTLFILCIYTSCIMTKALHTYVGCD